MSRRAGAGAATARARERASWVGEGEDQDAPRLIRRRESKSIFVSSGDDDNDENDNDNDISKRKGNGKDGAINSDSDSDSSLESPPPLRKRPPAVHQATLHTFLPPAAAAKPKLQRKSIALPSSSDSDSSLPPPPRPPRRSPAVAPSAKRKRNPPLTATTSPSFSSSESETTSHRAKKRNQQQRASPPPRTTARASSSSKDVPLDSSEDDDDDDLYFSDTSKPPPPSAKVTFRNALAKMKETRRAGLKAAPLPLSEEDSGPESGTSLSSSSESDIAEFIADEEDEAVELPQEFRLAASTLYDSFKIFIAFLIEIVLRGADDVPRPGQANQRSESNIRAIEKRVDGYRLSLLASEAWDPKFKDALNTYPIYSSHPAPPDSGVCDACRRTNHTAASEAVLSGPAYDRWTLASKLPTGSGRRSQMEEDFPRHVRFRPKTRKPELAFLLGRFCAKRSRMYSKLTHWKWAFFVRVREALKAGIKDLEAYSKDELLAYLQKEGLMDELWAEYNEMLEGVASWVKAK
ncbi:hypothetical protein HDU86_005543 [Geranomyces michiganensis]|nr:hypothetical protein HDU86_005543 [Geranomyces michiganensis]